MDNAGTAIQNLGTQEVRLIHENIPKQRLQHPKLWIYQYRNSPDQEWNSFYSFSEIEFFQEDFEVQNWWTSAKTLHRWTVLIVRFLREGESTKFSQNAVCGTGEDGQINVVGKVMLVNNAIKVNLGGKTQVVHEFNSEEARLQAIWEYFGISLTQEETQAILGWDLELKQ